jgi:hypothetical protein
MIFITLELVNKPVKFEVKTKHTYFFIFLLFLYIYKKTGMYRISYSYFTVKIHISIIQWNKKNARDLQINSEKSTNFFWNFLAYKKACLARYIYIKKKSKIKGIRHKGVFCQTHPCSNTNWAGWAWDPSSYWPFFFFTLA